MNWPPRNPDLGAPPIAALQSRRIVNEAQAKSAIVAAGFSDVSGLTQDQDGWSGKATKAGQPVTVRVDSGGKVTVI